MEEAVRTIVIGLGITLAGIIGLIAVVFLLLLFNGRSRFNEIYEVEVSTITVPSDEAVIARGEHLVSAVAHWACLQSQPARDTIPPSS